MKTNYMNRALIGVLLALATVIAMAYPLYAAENAAKPSALPEAKPSTDSAPQIVFAETEHDFGEVEKNQTVKHVFTFKNSGDALLIVNKPRATCGCTGTLLSASEVPPGGEGTIEVTYRTGSAGGKKVKSIYVPSNDPENPEMQLRIMATVVVPVEVRPRSLYWPLEKNKPSQRTLELVHQPEININITDLELSSPVFSASVSPEDDAETPTYTITVDYDGTLPIGNFRENLIIHTDNPDYPTLNVMLRGTVVGTVRVVPNAVALGVIQNDIVPSRNIKVYASKMDDFEIIALEPTSPLIKTVLTTDEKTDGYSIKVTLTEVPPPGAFSAKLHIKTNAPEEDTLEVPVYAFIR